MSNMTIPLIMNRIKSATKSSPIAVFECHRVGEEIFANAVFADTIISRQWIRERSHGFVGVFDGDMNTQEIEQTIRNAAA